MDKIKYSKIVKNNAPKEDVLKNAILAFVSGGILGVMGHAIIKLYMSLCHVSFQDASSYMIITLIFFGCLLTCFGWFDKVVNFFKCGLIIPITGFAHAMQASALEYKSEGFISGIGSNMFKLTGSVIAFGIISTFTFSLLRMLVGC